MKKESTSEVDLARLSGPWKKIEELDIQYERNKALIGQFRVNNFSIVTRNTSLIVLENLTDYLQYEIPPPVELRQEYDRLLKERVEARQTERALALTNALNYSDQLMEWWNTSYKHELPAKPHPLEEHHPLAGQLQEVVVVGYGAQRRKNITSSTTTVEPQASPSVADNSTTKDLDRRMAGVATVSPGANRAIVLRGTRTINQSGNADGNGLSAPVPGQTPESNSSYDSIYIQLSERSPDRSYLTAIAKAPAAKRFGAYLELRKDLLLLPTFYFDLAGYFYKQQDTITGLRILSNLAELDIEDHELYKLLGFKLRETGVYAEAVDVFRKVLQWRPQEPQSYRDYGLALADAGRYQDALDTLYLAIHRNYDANISGKNNGIEEMIVTEINDLVALHGDKLNLSAIDGKLLHKMPVDIRVVACWNMDNTDMDLWVTDPNGEKCYYGNKKTAIGGHISNDFTQGYGPEQFLLKHAIKGKYKIEMNYYGDRQFKVAGPTTVMVEIYTHFGGDRQVRKLITLQMQKDQTGGILIGEFNFD